MCVDLPHIKYKKEGRTVGYSRNSDYIESENKNKEILAKLKAKKKEEADRKASDKEKFSLTELFKGNI